MSETDDEPYENTLSVEELRKEVRRRWDTENALKRALTELPEVPDWRVLKLLSRAAKYPEDWELGKIIQGRFPFDGNHVPYKTEYEMGAGLWSRIRAGLIRTPSTGEEQ